ncbi:hypothetical protein ACU6DI_001444 [Vibrio navarrensis]|uniref:hypothetical protein n=1 Tax=Vibrio navarrensis TaxID=29495 RepID=UPI001558D1C6|nr:hypothetical protein [Vibrio navarrensis]MBE4583153.1 hypothetical protein [Vibrio navarrensis]
MKLLRSLSLISISLLVIGCTTLDSNSDFEDVVKSTKERSSYVELQAKSIQPDTQALIGTNLVKAELFYLAVMPKSHSASVRDSKIRMSVSYFKSYDSFKSANLLGNDIELVDYRPTAESCTEHCTVTQWFEIPVQQGFFNKFEGSMVTFLLSSGPKHSVNISVPKAYFSQVEKEGEFILGKDTGGERGINVSTPSKSETRSTEMVKYWYDKASELEQKEFINYAFINRDGIVEKVSGETPAMNMMVYWYGEATLQERKMLLKWLISQ